MKRRAKGKKKIDNDHFSGHFFMQAEQVSNGEYPEGGFTDES